MKKICKWLGESNRWKHLLGGVAIGFAGDSTYCSAYVGVGVASALEYKDREHGGKWDWIDWGLTVCGALIGLSVKLLIKAML